MFSWEVAWFESVQGAKRKKYAEEYLNCTQEFIFWGMYKFDSGGISKIEIRFLIDRLS